MSPHARRTDGQTDNAKIKGLFCNAGVQKTENELMNDRSKTFWSLTRIYISFIPSLSISLTIKKKKNSKSEKVFEILKYDKYDKCNFRGLASMTTFYKIISSFSRHHQCAIQQTISIDIEGNGDY